MCGATVSIVTRHEMLYPKILHSIWPAKKSAEHVAGNIAKGAVYETGEERVETQPVEREVLEGRAARRE